MSGEALYNEYARNMLLKCRLEIDQWKDLTTGDQAVWDALADYVYYWSNEP